MRPLLYVSAFLAFFACRDLDASDQAQPVSPVPSGTTVETIVFVRHGEKPDKEFGQLNCQGLNRALALPRVLTAKFGKPDYIFAPAPKRRSSTGGSEFNYIRPLETIEPTAIELGVPVNTDFSYTDIDGLRSELTSQKYRKALIFVAWEHHELECAVKQLVGQFGGDPKEVPKWDNKDFDSIYIVRVQNGRPAKSVSFTRDREGLDNLSTGCPGASNGS
jgi:hypothetical protein